MNAFTTPNQAFANCAYKEVREKQAEAFTNYLNSRPGTCGYVANLNGAWGTGKTFFVDNWCTKLSEQGYVSVKIDAWESDYLNDPLAIVTAEILTQLKKRSGREDFAEKEKQIFSSGWKLAKNFLPVLTMALGKHYLGKDYESLLKEIGVSVKGTIDDKSAPAPDFGDFGKEMFATHEKHKEFVQTFRANLGDLVKHACEISGKPKVYVFIDELDRCRPTYAIEMLEVVKHLFDIPNMVFVLSTDTTQLECSIKAVYGEQFDSEEYLSRFFQRRLSLSEPDYLSFVRAYDMFSQVPFENLKVYPMICKESAQEVFAFFCAAHDVSFRRAEQISARVEAALLNFDETVVVSIFEVMSNIFGYELFPKETYELQDIYTPVSGDVNPNRRIDPKHLGDEFGSYSYEVIKAYEELWQSIKMMSKCDIEFRAALKHDCLVSLNNLKEQITRFENDMNFGNFVRRSYSKTPDFYQNHSNLIDAIFDNDYTTIERDELNDYLHIFDSFS
ncbi:TPA: P-loop NTPase fold protein [Vibrio alginolyticus]